MNHKVENYNVVNSSYTIILNMVKVPQFIVLETRFVMIYRGKAHGSEVYNMVNLSHGKSTAAYRGDKNKIYCWVFEHGTLRYTFLQR